MRKQPRANFDSTVFDDFVSFMDRSPPRGEITHMASETGHGTQKPVEAMRRPIENNSKPGQAVYDPFLGSGTIMVAAEMTGRTCYGVEINPTYVDVSVLRWEQFTGKKAELAGHLEPEAVKGAKVVKSGGRGK